MADQAAYGDPAQWGAVPQDPNQYPPEQYPQDQYPPGQDMQAQYPPQDQYPPGQDMQAQYPPQDQYPQDQQQPPGSADAYGADAYPDTPGGYGMDNLSDDLEEAQELEDERDALEQAMREELLAMVARSEGPGEFYGFVNTPRGRNIARKFYIAGEDGLQVTLTNYGARLISVRMPDFYGAADEVVVGLDNLTDYEMVRDQRLGCVVGRMSCPLIGQLQENGFSNFDEMAWETHLKSASHVVFSLHSPAGEQDYPGDVLATVEYSLEPGNHLLLRLTASCSAPCPLSLCVRVPFNLAGQRSGAAGLRDHRLMINSRKFLEHDKDKTVTGEIRRSCHHGLSFLAPTSLEKAFMNTPAGFDHHLILNGYPSDGLRFVARLSHRGTGRSVEIYSDSQCLHLDTLNELKVPGATDEEGEGVLGVIEGIIHPIIPPIVGPGNQAQEPQMKPPPAGRGLRFNDDALDQEISEDYSETWGEMDAATTGAGEDADDTRGLEDVDIPIVRVPYELTPKCAIILAPEDYPDTIFDKEQKATKLLPGQRYERVVRITFTTEQPAKRSPRVSAAGRRPGPRRGVGWAGDDDLTQAAPTPATPSSRGPAGDGAPKRVVTLA